MLLVTGITGHTGRYFLKELIEHNYDGKVRCVIRESSDTSQLDQCGLQIEKVVGDLNDLDFIDRSMIGVDTVMHIYNIHYSPTIVKSAINHQVNRVILVHTAGIYSRFKKAAREYKQIEEEIQAIKMNSGSSINITILRPTMIYGDLCDRNISKLIRLVDKLPLIPVIHKGYSLLQPVHALDLGKAYYMVLMAPTNSEYTIYDLSGDRPITLCEIYQLIGRELGKKIVLLNLPKGLAISVAAALSILTFGRINLTEKVQRMCEDRSCSHDVAAEELGYSPMKFEDGIKYEIEEYKMR